MPFNFSGQSHSTTAKLGVVFDGDTFTGAPTVLASGSTASLTFSGSTVTLTGGSGFVSGMTGDKIFISGAATSANNGWMGTTTTTITYISATSVSWTNASGATDANNGKISYQVAALPVTTTASKPSSYSIFAGSPVRSATGVWSLTTKDSVVLTCDVHIASILPTGGYISTQLLPETIDATGRKVINWVFNVAGTPTDLPYPGSFRAWMAYSETKPGVI